jgi:class 3 adenylate cyclase
MARLPTGTVTLLFTDVDRSTELVKRLGERYGKALTKHHELVRSGFTESDGIEIDTQGDAFFVVFDRASDAVSAAVAIQRALAAYPWPDNTPVSVRMGLHTGEPYLSEDRYVGLAVHRAARICTAAHGGQVLLSGSTAAVVEDVAIRGVSLRDLGEHELKDIERPERIFQLVVEGLPSDFPRPRTVQGQIPLSGTVTIVMAEGRRLMRLAREITPEEFGHLLESYQRILGRLFDELGGRDVEFLSDMVLAAFPTAKQAALAAAAAHRAVAAHEWPGWPQPAISVGLHSGEAGIGWVGPAASRCSELCEAAEGGQTFMSQATAGLLEEDDLGDLSLRDVGEQQARRSGRAVRAYELVA